MIHSSIKESLGFDPNESDAEFLKKWNKLTSNARKPCWDLKYCPYGELVEEFPLLPSLRGWAVKHNEYLKECLARGTLGVEPHVKPLDEKRRDFFEKVVAEFDPEDHPEEIPSEISDWSCRIFGHICPVVFSAEYVAEEPPNTN